MDRYHFVMTNKNSLLQMDFADSFSDFDFDFQLLGFVLIRKLNGNYKICKSQLVTVNKPKFDLIILLEYFDVGFNKQQPAALQQATLWLCINKKRLFLIFQVKFF